MSLITRRQSSVTKSSLKISDKIRGGGRQVLQLLFS